MAYYAVIMAGGTGTRLWPLSRRKTPKQSLRLLDDRTLFQSAVDRILPLFGRDRIRVVAGADYLEDLARQAPGLPSSAFVVEPSGRGTAPCIGLASIHLRHEDPSAVMAVLTADQTISDVARFRRVLMAAESVAQQGWLVTLGIAPAGPATGYGYIEQAEELQVLAGFRVFRVAQFTEKPDLEAAQEMVASGRFSWNSGMFIWRVDQILEEFERQMPDLYDRLSRIEAALGRLRYKAVIESTWTDLSKQTIDYGVMEGAGKVAVIPVDIGWSDVGSWASLGELLPTDEYGNVIRGPHTAIDTRNTVVMGGKRLIATIGMRDMIIVDSDDALLICPRGREQDVREIVRKLDREGRHEYL
jgi:mannose-1-phosphate guanylyltransferase